MKIAIIDLGTNTFNILIVEVHADKTVKHLFQTKISVKLGEGGIDSGCIAPPAFQRGLDAMEKYKLTLQKYEVEKVMTFATSAIRTASNGNDFVQQVKEKTGIEIEMITGDREAELIYYGVRNAVQMNETASLIIDIGGGSTEFIIANKEQIFWKKSFMLGASRLWEKFKPSDPMKEEEIEELKNYLQQELVPLFEAVKKFPVTELIGSSGSFDSLAEMIAHRFYTPGILNGRTEYDFDLDECVAIYDQILGSSRAERLKMKGLIEMRVDMMVISSIFVHFVVTTLELNKMRLSTYSLKEGVLQELLSSHNL